MGIACSEDKKRKNLNLNLKQENIENKVPFPEGEHYYKLVNDTNITNLRNNKNNLSQRVELFFSLNEIKNPNNRYSFSVSIINNKRTKIESNLGKLNEETGENIIFGDSFEVDYFFEKVQTVIIQPIINGKEQGAKEEFILSKLMSSKEGKIEINLEDVGKLEISYQNKKDKELKKEISCFQFSITLDNELFKNHKYLEKIFYVIRNIKDRNIRRPVYKSHEYNFNLNEKKQTSLISLDSDLLCNNNEEKIFFELYSPSKEKNQYIGYTYFTLNKLKSNLNNDKTEIIDINSDEFGKLGVLSIFYNKTEKLGIEKFVKKGKISLEIAIDYTASNENENEISLHYKDGETPNDYEKAIKSCVNIVAPYDSDELFPVYGFGGIPKAEGKDKIIEGKDKVSHCFNINFSEDDGNIYKVDNILKFYKDSLDKVKLSGPSFLSPVIKKVIDNVKNDLERMSQENKLENHYYILMILTDGIINDIQETIDSIVEGSKLPFSIIIIGVGNADFTSMDILDGDKEALINSKGEIRKRDIVQFVPFNRFKKKGGVNDGDELAEEVLKEIPRQIEEYYQFCGTFHE